MSCSPRSWLLSARPVFTGFCFLFAGGLQAESLRNEAYEISLAKGGVVEVRATDGSTASFEPRFTVLASDFDPKFALRYPVFGEKRMEKNYNVASWSTSAVEKTAAPKPKGHVEDGFDPTVDQAASGDRVFDIFKAAPVVSVTASGAEVRNGKVVWIFPDQELFTLKASLALPAGRGEPLLTFEFTPKVARWFSVGYTGAPATAVASVEEIWQPLIWQEKRFPNQAYLTESGRCTLPATLVAQAGITTGVVADPSELPFMPMPTVQNSRFGVAVRNAEGQAQSTIFAPLLGGDGSHLEAGSVFSFKLRLFVTRGGIPDAYERLARGLYQFRDYRSNNGIGSLNRTMERMIDYAMSKWARFNEDLRGAAYETDVPGSVKNVSSLHPLEIALVTDDAAIFEHRARPMIEYALSREKFLFTTDPKVKGQSASSNLTGPCAQVSELAALYAMSNRRSPFLLELAENLLGATRTLNLDEPVRGNIWQNWLAMYDATGDGKWLEKAKAGADDYLHERFETRQTDFSDKKSRGMFFWTSYAPNWIELFALYEATGDKRYLEASRAGARRFTQFIWMCPTVPDGNVQVNDNGEAPRYRAGDKYQTIKLPAETVPAWRVSEIGLTPEASGTCKGHRAIFPAAFAPWMLQLDEETGDTFLHDVARSAIIGRYASFPGYHMNTARTTVYEKPDFAERPIEELNSTTSLHYNHIWPHIAILLDYLVSDVKARSAGAISFPSHFAEGYAYLQSKIYGDRAGKFYGEEAWLWMPKGLVTCDNPEVNYIAARGQDGLYLALTNQSAKAVTATVTIDPALAGFPAGQESETRIWQDKQAVKTERLKPGKFSVAIAPNGITSLDFGGVKPQAKFQQKLQSPGPAWKTDSGKMDFAGAHAMVLNFAGDLQSAYVYLQAREGIAQATLHYSTGGEWKTLTDAAYPFEFTVPLPAEAGEFSWKIETSGLDGQKQESEVAKLSR